MYIHKKLNTKVLLICFVFVQAAIVGYLTLYRKNTTPWSDKNDKVSFLQQDLLFVKNRTYHTEGRVFLNRRRVRNNYVDFNSSICLTNGTDINAMKRSKHSVWKCLCDKNWHGADCGQPEMIWRALLSSRGKIAIKGPRKYSRLVVNIIKVDEFFENIIEIIVNELYEVVDLFILLENENTHLFRNKLDNNYLRQFHTKIKYINSNENPKTIWKEIKTQIHLNKDDLVMINTNYEIPNKYIILFLKYYDNWPEPITFRVRWSVFGFFWRHPDKTKTEGFLCTVHCMDNIRYDNRSSKHVQHNRKRLIIGDLNFFGGWYCEWCNYPIQIIDYLNRKSRKIDFKDRTKIDGAYFEDLIENGLYIDGKTELERSRKYLDNFFSPYYLNKNPWKYDYLLTNMYSKLDYQEELF